MTKTLHLEKFDGGRVARWGLLTADMNPLHTDAEFAATTDFRVPIVHGHLIACSVLDAVQAELGAYLTNGGSLSVRFLEPVPVGETAELRWSENEGLVQVVCVDTGQVQAEARIRGAAANE